MSMTLTQILLTIFLLFTVSRVILRYRSGEVSLHSMLFWITIFGTATIAVLFPWITSGIAKSLGIGRGVDAVIYASIVLIFYLIFRLYVFLEDIRHEITDLIQKIAIKDLENENKKSTTQN